MTKASIHSLKQFFQTESSQDAFRNILSILIPSMLVYYFLNGQIAIAFAVGILLASLTDLPGNKQDKKTTAAYCIPIFLLTAVTVSYALYFQSWIVIVLLGLFGFGYTIIALLGFRINVVGNLGLIVASFTIGLRPTDPLVFSLSLIAGTLVFFSISLLQVQLFPYRSLRFAVNGGIENMAKLLALKVACYQPETSLPKTYKALSALHIRVSEQLEAIRSLLLRDKNLQKENDRATQIWLNKLYQLIDLYELLMAVDHDYEHIRELLKQGNNLALIQRCLSILSLETKKLSSSNKNKQFLYASQLELEQIFNQLEENLKQGNPAQKELLLSIIKQLRQVSLILQQIDVQDEYTINSALERKQFKDFVQAQSNFETIKNNLSFKSPIFSYAVRMAVLLMLGGLIGYLLPEFRYASWILLTIILVARPSFNTTQKRNYQRIIGSLIGIGISLLLLLLIPNNLVLLAIAAFCLYLFLLFNRPNYLVCVIFITITILLGQHIHESDMQALLGSRFGFTLLGSIFAVLGCLAIPINHFRSVEQYSDALIEHFRSYLEKIKESYQTQQINHYDLRLLRKVAQASLAQCYDSMEQFAKEPIKGRLYQADIAHFQTLAYRINALLVGLSIQMTKLGFQSQSELMNERFDYVQELIEEAANLSKSISENRVTSFPIKLKTKSNKAFID